uniref:Transposase n=1 Tax=Heterorhabditis bacteriophora TaxID=37862 RepID=A0A1I7W9J1_HETBA
MTLKLKISKKQTKYAIILKRTDSISKNVEPCIQALNNICNRISSLIGNVRQIIRSKILLFNSSMFSST